MEKLTNDQKIKAIADYVANKCGGGVQFHDLNELCLSSKDGKSLFEVVKCKVSKEHPFGVKEIPFTKEEMLDKILNEIL